jgi:hypothetical protein
MKLYLKVTGCSCYTCLPQSSPAAAQRILKKVAPGTPPVAQRLLTIIMSKHGNKDIHLQFIRFYFVICVVIS